MSGPEPTEPRKVAITLHRDGVKAPAMAALQSGAGALVTSLKALDGADLASPVQVPGSAMTFTLQDGFASADERREAYRNWLLARGFQDLARGLRGSLEEAYQFVELAKLHGAKVGKVGVRSTLDEARAKANKLNFPDLMAALNPGLSQKLHWEAEFFSLQKVRNCLEHRQGVVTAGKDTDPGVDTLTLSIPRLQMVVRRDGKDVEVSPLFLIKKDEAVTIRSTTRTKTFNVGDKISFTAEEFGEIAFAVWIMTDELASKLPSGPPPTATAVDET